MARAYSLDLRERVVAAVRSGQSCRRVAATFELGVATVVKWWQRYRTTGNVAAKPRGGSKARALVDVQDWVLDRVAAEPHVTTRALAGELAGTRSRGQPRDGVGTCFGATPDSTKKTVHRPASRSP